MRPVSETHSIVVERIMPHPPETIWRVLTDPQLIAEWLMQNDFRPAVGHIFQFRARPMVGWNGMADCEVLTVDPPRRLAWSQNASGDQAATGLRSIVTWTLTPQDNGTHVCMTQAGFELPKDAAGYKAMSGGWPHVLANLERVAAAGT